MTAGAASNNNDVIRAREFYSRLLSIEKDINTSRMKTADAIAQSQEKNQIAIKEMEDRIMNKLDSLPALCEQVNHNKSEIQALKKRSNILDYFNMVLAAVAATISGIVSGNTK